MKQLKHISIRTKLLTVLIATTVVVLLAYAQVSFSSFTSDKVAYVFDSTLSHARATSSLIKTEIEKQLDKIQTLLLGYNPSANSFSSSSQVIFANSADLESLQIYKINSQSAEPELISNLTKTVTNSVVLEPRKLRQLVNKAIRHQVAITAIQDQLATWALAIRSLDPRTGQLIISVATLNTGHFLEAISKGNIQNVYLLDGDKNYVIRPLKPPNALDEKDLQDKFRDIDMKTRASGVNEIILADKARLLTSFTQVGIGELHVAEVVPKAKAIEAITTLLYTTGKILLLLIGLTILISVLVASGLTTNLNRLLLAVQDVAKGNLDTSAQVASRDEIGDLAVGFNHMTSEIRRLVVETKEKARMEGELKTARVVQSMLFPASSAVFAKTEINGFYQPASECSGDWWNYYASGSKVYVAIGDATGHGVPAALVTSATRSAFLLLSQSTDLSVAKWMEKLNQAIFATMQGQIHMTFFLGCLDQDTGLFTYANASHDPPFWFPYQSATDKLKFADAEPLTEANGPRLGESGESRYTEETIQMKPGQVISFTTDGVVDITSPENKTYGDRRLIENLLKSFNQSRDVSKASLSLQADLDSFRKNSPLNDDVTFFMMGYNA